jgi:hypothetical protein
LKALPTLFLVLYLRRKANMEKSAQMYEKYIALLKVKEFILEKHHDII